MNFSSDNYLKILVDILMLIKIIIFGIILQMSFAEADPKICNYKKYPKTNSEYKLQKLDVSFEHTLGITSISNERR